MDTTRQSLGNFGGNTVEELILREVRKRLKINTTVAYPDILEEKNDQQFSGYQIFDKLVPQIDEKIALIIFNSSFGQIGGTLFTQAVKIKAMMKNQYSHMEKMLGTSRFQKIINFPKKLSHWKQKNLPHDEIQKRFVKSVVRLFFSSARRDPEVFSRDLLPILREQLKSFLLHEYPHISQINSLVLDAMARDTYKKLDFSHAHMHTKNLIGDLQMYSTIIYFINQFNEFKLLRKDTSVASIVDIVREEITQITSVLRKSRDFRRLIKKQMKFLGEN